MILVKSVFKRYTIVENEALTWRIPCWRFLISESWWQNEWLHRNQV